MSKLKRGLASALASLLLSAMLPVGALAADEEPGSIPADEVIFNTGNMEITVGSDPDKESELPYTTFDEEGNYTIELPEEDPFFPYEVQFQYDGETTEEWFEDEDDTVEIGGHTFSVSVENGESQRLGFYVGDEYIPTRPKAKEFENDPDAGISPTSLLPLDNLILAAVNLEEMFPSELENVRVELLFGSNTVEEDAVVSWKVTEVNSSNTDNDDYAISGIGQNINLRKFYSERWLELEFIVGTADPLDPRNKRFTVDIDLADDDDFLEFTACDVNGNEINIYNEYYEEGGENYYNLSVAPDDWTEGNAYVSFAPGKNSAVAALSEQDIQDIRVYEGYYESMADIERAKANDITHRIWKQTGKDGYFADYGERFDSLPRFTVVFCRDGEVVEVMPFAVEMHANHSKSISSWYNLFKDSETGNNRESVAVSDKRSSKNYNSSVVYRMENANYPADGLYYLKLSFSYPDPKVDSNDLIKCAYIGNFKEEKDIPADAENIKEQLFGGTYNEGGYKADFSKGITFTVIDTFGTIFHYTVKTIPYEETLPKDEQPRGYDPYFQIGGALKEDGTKLNAYFMKPDDDSYYANGYQTVFLLDGEQNDTVTEEKIRPKYTVYPHETPSVAGADDAPVIIFASHDYEGAEKQFSEQNAIEFQSGKVLHYSAATRDKERLKNYWVTFVTRHEGGAKLFVNAVTNSEHRDSETNIPIREVFLDEQHGYYHDIFIANIGDEELTDLSVELTDAENVQLDEYWRFGGENQVNKLAPFTDFSKENNYGWDDEKAELKNATKIRLIPTETNGKISGKLTISGKAGGETVSETVMLTGTVRVPTITTESLRPAVRHVPYSTLIQTDNMYGSRDVRFEWVAGEMAGLKIYPNGELYGAPLATGTFTFTVRATYKNDPAASDEKEFTLVVEDNTNLNVWDETDEEYDVIDTDGETIANESTDEHDYILEQYADQIFLSKGPYDEFVIFWLDGKEMVRGTDYLADEGSTKITVLKQTLEKAGKGSHTIAAEFRENGRERSGTLKTAAQNYRINVDPPKSNNNTNGGGGGHATRPGGGSSGTTSTTGTPTKKPDTSSRPEPEMPFTDVQVNDWFYDNVLWAYQQELMVGMSSSRFGSEESISQATIVATLARLADIDLSRFENETEPDVEAGQWFTAAAIWAKRSGLLPDRSRFTGNEDISRGQMAVMLAKYLRSVGLGEPENAQPVQFADAAQMTDEEAAAFRVLYARGVFYGVGGNRMEPAGTTTRSQFAALLNRISDVLDER